MLDLPYSTQAAHKVNRLHCLIKVEMGDKKRCIIKVARYNLTDFFFYTTNKETPSSGAGTSEPKYKLLGSSSETPECNRPTQYESNQSTT